LNFFKDVSARMYIATWYDETEIAELKLLKLLDETQIVSARMFYNLGL
jgi:hypothetical protein